MMRCMKTAKTSEGNRSVRPKQRSMAVRGNLFSLLPANGWELSDSPSMAGLSPISFSWSCSMTSMSAGETSSFFSRTTLVDNDKSTGGETTWRMTVRTISFSAALPHSIRKILGRYR